MVNRGEGIPQRHKTIEVLMMCVDNKGNYPVTQPYSKPSHPVAQPYSKGTIQLLIIIINKIKQ